MRDHRILCVCMCVHCIGINMDRLAEFELNEIQESNKEEKKNPEIIAMRMADRQFWLFRYGLDVHIICELKSADGKSTQRDKMV